MSIGNRFPNRLAGIPWIEVHQNITSGRIFWVDSTLGSDNSTQGDDPRTPFATIDYAIGKCTANKLDIIYVMPGYTQTLSTAAAIDCDVEGITIIGLGSESDRPTLTLSATTADFDFNADNVRIKNFKFVAGVDDLENFITVGANYATIEDCYFEGGATYQFLCGVNIETTFDNTTIKGCTFNQSTDPGGTNAAAGTGAIFIVDSENVLIENCKFYGNIETAFIHNRTTAALNLFVRDCLGYCALSDAFPFVLVEGATGGDMGCLWITPAAVDFTTAVAFGIESTKFFSGSYYGNDSVGGGQGAGRITAAT